MSVPPVHVLGAGSIGLLVAWHLRHASIPVVLLASSPESLERMRLHGKVTMEFAGQPGSCLPIWRQSGHPPQPISYPVDVEPCQPMPAQARTINQLVVATKAADTAAALRSLRGRLDPNGSILLMQNGILGVYSEIVAAGVVPLGSSLLLGSVTHGAFRKATCHVVHSGCGAIKLAQVDPSLPDLSHEQHQQVWDRAGLPLRSDSGGCSGADLSSRVLADAMGLAGQVTDRHEMESQNLQGRASRTASQTHRIGLLQLMLGLPGLAAEFIPSHFCLMQQVASDASVALAHCRGLALPWNTSCSTTSTEELLSALPLCALQVHQKLAVNCAVNPGTALLGCLNREYADNAWGRQMALNVCEELFELFGGDLLGAASHQDLSDMVLRVAASTGNNKNSMLQDVLAGRATEIDYLNGYVVSWADRQGKNAPVNKMLHALIKAKEALGQAASRS